MISDGVRPVPQPFGQDVIAAVCRHMNEDHSNDSLLICRMLGGMPRATEARAVSVDAQAMHFTATVAGVPTRVAVRFAEPVSERPQIRLAVVELYERACAVAGVPIHNAGHEMSAARRQEFSCDA